MFRLLRQLVVTYESKPCGPQIALLLLLVSSVLGMLCVVSEAHRCCRVWTDGMQTDRVQINRAQMHSVLETPVFLNMFLKHLLYTCEIALLPSFLLFSSFSASAWNRAGQFLLFPLHVSKLSCFSYGISKLSSFSFGVSRLPRLYFRLSDAPKAFPSLPRFPSVFPGFPGYTFACLLFHKLPLGFSMLSYFSLLFTSFPSDPCTYWVSPS
jgi:hypothetical protein